MPSHFLLEKLINHGSHHLGAKECMETWVDQLRMEWKVASVENDSAERSVNTEYSFSPEHPVATMCWYLSTSSRIFFY